jgi:pyruvate/2-oxoglutarate dehydrogenase complex dihydrolipoamide dehydrogenase (E3) component
MSLTPQRAKELGQKSTRKGIPNRSTTEIRQKINDIIQNNISKLQDDIDKLEPKDRIKTIIELSKFVLPTLKAVDMENTTTKKHVIINLGNDPKPLN